MNALASYPRARECGKKVNVAPRLMLDPVDERLAMMVDQVSKSAASEGCEAGARQRMDEVAHQVERLLWRQRTNDLAKPSPREVGNRGALAEIIRVSVGESNELDR